MPTQKPMSGISMFLVIIIIIIIDAIIIVMIFRKFKTILQNYVFKNLQLQDKRRRGDSGDALKMIMVCVKMMIKLFSTICCCFSPTRRKY